MSWLFNIFDLFLSPRIPNPDPEDPWIRIRNTVGWNLLEVVNNYQCWKSGSSWIQNFYLDPVPELFVSDSDLAKRKKQIKNNFFISFFALMVQKILVDCSFKMKNICLSLTPQSQSPRYIGSHRLIIYPDW